jgi:hypothetical protein
MIRVMVPPRPPPPPPFESLSALVGGRMPPPLANESPGRAGPGRAGIASPGAARDLESLRLSIRVTASEYPSHLFGGRMPAATPPTRARALSQRRRRRSLPVVSLVETSLLVVS